MGKSQEEESDAWRILLFGRNGAELLLVRSPAGLRLPELRIPRWQRIVPNLNAVATEFQLGSLDGVSVDHTKLVTIKHLDQRGQGARVGEVEKILPIVIPQHQPRRLTT